MKAVAQLALISGISLMAAGVTFFITGAPQKPLHVCSPALLAPDEICLDMVAANALWIDARPRSEWKENGVEGSILWNLEAGEDANAFEAEAAIHIISAQSVVVYCGSEACGTSREIVKRINQLQLGPEAKVLHGGWIALRDGGKVTP